MSCLIFNTHAAGDQTYSGQGYPIPSEDDYYQQEPVEEDNDDCSSLSSTRKGKPMPKESSFFIFSSQNRWINHFSFRY